MSAIPKDLEAFGLRLLGSVPPPLQVPFGPVVRDAPRVQPTPATPPPAPARPSPAKRKASAADDAERDRIHALEADVKRKIVEADLSLKLLDLRLHIEKLKR